MSLTRRPSPEATPPAGLRFLWTLALLPFFCSSGLSAESPLRDLARQLDGKRSQPITAMPAPVKRARYVHVKTLALAEVDAVTASGRPFFLALSAKWCQPCWEEKNWVEDRYASRPGPAFCSVDIESADGMAVCRRLRLDFDFSKAVIPTTFLIRGTRVQERLVGFDPEEMGRLISKAGAKR